MARVMEDGIYVMIARGFEESDVSTTTRSLRRSGFSVAVVGLSAGPVRGAYGLRLAPDRALSEVETKSPRAVVLPGGMQASRQLSADPRVHHLLRRIVDGGGYVVAIDSAYTVLRSAGVLQDDGPQSGDGVPGELGEGTARVVPGGMPLRDSGRVEMDGQVIFGRDSGSAQEAALTLAWLLERGVAGQRFRC